MNYRLQLIVCLLGCLGFAAAGADESQKPAPEKPPQDAAKKPDKDTEKQVDSRHSITINGQKIDYTARAGTIFLRDRENKPTAEIFYIAYTKDSVTNFSQRPVTFSFNGGPGSSSVWMHMGLLGPRRVVLTEAGRAVPSPYKMTENAFSLLDETDLVFIDPVSTGFSRAVKPDEARNFFGLEEDTRSVAEFIRLYITRQARWTSPKFIIGESYGTTRAAALATELRNRHRMSVNGIMLVSTVLNFQTLSFAGGNDLVYVMYLPTYTATAWYHKKLAPDLQKLPLKDVLAAVEEFAGGDYNAALLQGAALPTEKRRKIVAQMARFTGLPADFVERSDLRVSLGRFTVELLRGENRVLGRFDTRYSGYLRDREASGAPYDPSFEEVVGAFAGTFNHYVRTELKFESDQSYETLVGVGPWNWGANNSYVNVAESLADTLTKDPFLKVHVSCGFYDLATPYFAARYTFNHLGVDADLIRNITLDYYGAGHMMYLNLPDLKKQKEDLARFIRQTVELAR